jgi:hypothetical protein
LTPTPSTAPQIVSVAGGGRRHRVAIRPASLAPKGLVWWPQWCGGVRATTDAPLE